MQKEDRKQQAVGGKRGKPNLVHLVKTALFPAFAAVGPLFDLSKISSNRYHFLIEAYPTATHWVDFKTYHMDSINQQQPEDNFKDLQGNDATKKIKELVDSAKSCFFCTNIQTGKPFDTRPMAVQKVDDEGNFWFLSSDDSHKNAELETDPSVQLLFQGSAHSDFLNIYGMATVSKDKEKIKELWEPILKTWFTGGVDDERITVIKVDPSEGYYWDNKHGNAVAFVKQMAGAIVGKTLDDSIEGKLSV